jgi:signal transduction histidine kinase
MGNTGFNTHLAIFPNEEKLDSDFFDRKSIEVVAIAEDSDPELVEKIKYELKRAAASETDLTTGEITTRSNHFKFEIWRTDDSFKVALRNRTSEQRIINSLVEKLAVLEMQHIIGRKAPRYAHGINNVLTAIFGMAQLLECRNSSPEENKKYISTIYEAVERGKDLSRSMMDPAKPRDQNLDSIVITDSLDYVLRNVYYDINKNIQIEKKYTKDPPTVEGNVKQITNLLLSVLQNAYDSIETQGRIIVSVEPYYNPSKISYESIKVSIEDNGGGMDDEMLQLWKTPDNYDYISRKKEGNGIGRIIVLNILSENNIRYSVQSKQGVGTKFSFYFKKHIEEPEEDDPLLTLGKL